MLSNLIDYKIGFYEDNLFIIKFKEFNKRYDELLLDSKHFQKDFITNIKEEIKERYISYGIMEPREVRYDYERLNALFELSINQVEIKKKCLVQEKTLPKNKNPPDEKNKTAPSAHSNHQFFLEKGGGSLNEQDLHNYLKERQWDYCIWIDKLDRVHNLKASGTLDTDHSVWVKLIRGLNIQFDKSNGQAFITRNSVDGLGFTWQIRNSGKVRFWFEDTCSWELIFYNLQKLLEPCKIKTDELKYLIEKLKETDEGLFELEVANETGPAKIIKRLLNKACLIYQQVYFKGKYYPVLIKIDKSKGPYEIEFIGPYGPTKALQDLTVRSFEVVESLGRFEFIIGNLVSNWVKTHEIQRETFHILDKRLKKIDNDHLGQEILLTGISAKLHQNEQLIRKTFNEIKELKDKNEILTEVFPDSRCHFKNNLYLLLRLISKVPGITTKNVIKELKNELNLSSWTVYRYFNQLQEKKLVKSKKKKYPPGAGRKIKSYYLTKKAKQILKLKGDKKNG